MPFIRNKASTSYPPCRDEVSYIIKTSSAGTVRPLVGGGRIQAGALLRPPFAVIIPSSSAPAGPCTCRLSSSGAGGAVRRKLVPLTSVGSSAQSAEGGAALRDGMFFVCGTACRCPLGGVSLRQRSAAQIAVERQSSRMPIKAARIEKGPPKARVPGRKNPEIALKATDFSPHQRLRAPAWARTI